MTSHLTGAPGAAAGAAAEIARGERFAFGANWSHFLEGLTADRVTEAERSLRELLGATSLAGQSFLDIGSGSGLFSLAARRLGARVHSLDYDPQSVACTRTLRARFFPDDTEWTVEQGSALDQGYLGSLGRFDIVYSWGVLHHTGAMWTALDLAAERVAPGGLLTVAIYNRQRVWTPFWIGVKRSYLALPAPLRPLLVWPYVLVAGAASAIGDLRRGRAPWRRWQAYGPRGMDLYHDAVDWVGGWPFEVATPAELTSFFTARGLDLRSARTVGNRHGCNEFVFHRPRPR
ncbi:MAG: class I SAM-dependent methyltransferase [Gemmatimonadetes bacterium]|nr:class I SAM-dependent methyltransferase [Gemmatimonadota bacterium]